LIGNTLIIKDLCHSYSNNHQEWVLKSINLKVKSGELLGLLGPSGCGKTTLLRLIAGFESPSMGYISYDQNVLSSSRILIPPENRQFGMVFQDYALFPHLNLWKNTVFGVSSSEGIDRAHYLLEILGLSHFLDRYPHQLSGGQKQRLALARALAPGTSFILLDEPFCSLDLQVRLKLRSELPNLLKTCGTGGLLVTHDPEEALAICDKVAVMNDGEIHQCSKPIELINSPKTIFVNEFIVRQNIISLIKDKDIINYLLLNSNLSKEFNNQKYTHFAFSDLSVLVSIDKNGDCQIISKEFLGEYFILKIKVFDKIIRVRSPLNQFSQVGDNCFIKLNRNSNFLLYPGPERIKLT
tara:strand:- start:714 stop:1772 length:1059 start_codon:yes stop_codon:yes gene_type:complete